MAKDSNDDSLPRGKRVSGDNEGYKWMLSDKTRGQAFKFVESAQRVEQDVTRREA